MDLGTSAGALMGRSLTMGAARPAAGRVMGGPEGGRPPPPEVTLAECGASWGVVEWACCTGKLP